MRPAVLVLALLLGSQAPDPPTIAERLAKASVTPKPPLSKGLQELRLTNTGEIDGDREYALAGWEEVDRLKTLHVLLVDRRAGTWRQKDFEADDSTDNPANLGGSVTAMYRSPSFLAIELHQTPSASSTWVLSPKLSKVGAFYGWITTTLPNELMVFRRSAIHFAPTHYVEISVFDPAHGKSVPIYPPRQTDAVRRAFIDQVTARWKALGAVWMNSHNHHGDPQRFDNTLGRTVVDWPHAALAFEVLYDDQTGVKGLQAPLQQRVIVTCDGLAKLDTIACRETAAEAVERAFPGDTDEALLRRAAAAARR
jgi:hypothetical protein